RAAVRSHCLLLLPLPVQSVALLDVTDAEPGADDEQHRHRRVRSTPTGRGSARLARTLRTARRARTSEQDCIESDQQQRQCGEQREALLRLDTARVLARTALHPLELADHT